MIDLLVLSENDTFTLSIELRSTSSSEDLLNIKDADIFVSTLVGVIDLGSFDDNTIGWQVDTPSKSGRGAQHLDVALRE